MPRKCDDLINDYLKFVSNTESPMTYHLWACLGMISAAMERSVLMRWGHTQIYPNQYIILIGPSGVRKAEPIIVAHSFLEEVGANLIAESITKEALIRRMKEVVSSFAFPYDDQAEELKFQCAVTCTLEEMAVFLDGDPKFLAVLTNWYDSRDKWTYETKNQGTDEIQGVCLNIIGAMAPDWIPMVIPTSAIGGGFTSRVVFVVEHKKGRTVTNPNLTKVDQDLKRRITSDLEDIMAMRGEMIFHPQALALYEDWYITEENKTAQGRPAVADPRFSGYVSRRQTLIKKLGMAISAARSASLIITEMDLKRAIGIMEQAEINMAETFERIGRSMYAEATQQIMRFIQEKGTTSRREVMQMFYRDVDVKGIEIIEGTLRATGFIKVDANPDTLTWTYTWMG